MGASTVRTALLLTLMGAMGTALGGLLVVIQPSMSFKRLGALQGLAAGLMLSISVMDLLPEAAEEIGFTAANACFYLGVLFFAAIVKLIPEPDSSFFADGVTANNSADDTCTTVVHQCKKQDVDLVVRVQAVAPGSSKAVRCKPGLVRTASTGQDCAVTDLQQQADKQQQPGLVCRRSSVTPSTESHASDASADLDVVLDELDSDKQSSSSLLLKRQLLMSGVITAVGIALHNFPEGVAVFLAAQKSPAIGLSLAMAIGLHNVPEGVGVALPIYFATGSRWKGFQAAALSGLAEPLAVLLLGLLFPIQMNKHVIDCMLAGVGGIMAFLAFHELLPLAVQHAGKSLAVACLFAGMALMSFNLHLLNTYVLAGLH